MFFSDEVITPRKQPAAEKLPSLLRAARSLERGAGWHNRELLFLKQAKLLANYEDDYSFNGSPTRYYPTYQSLTDQELRGYFSWRTKIRRGELQKAPLTFAFLYIYELLNQIGAETPIDGFRKLTAFRDAYGELDSGILSYLKYWLRDYVVYYDLEPALLDNSPLLTPEQSITVLENLRQETPQAVVKALMELPLKWLNRSKFYQTHTQDMDQVIHRVLSAVAAHCETQCKKSFLEQYVGRREEEMEWLFSSAVFCDPLKRKEYEYTLNSRCVYRCHKGHWSVDHFRVEEYLCAKLDDLLKTIDREMRAVFDPKHPIQSKLTTKWILKLIHEEIQALQEQKRAAEVKKITIDRSQLAKIRQDAAVTREKLMVDEELEETPPEAPAPQVPSPPEEPSQDSSQDSLLNPTEYRLLQCLLYDRDRSWVRTEGIILSVLLDSINEKLYDEFQDTVLDETGIPIPDYIDELKEMVLP